jgi:2-amino-4-hydroxy-6-hydroxymethyldihydropteridine diphosphokinase
MDDRLANITAAIDAIKKEVGDVLRRSSYYETEPWGMPNQDLFINMVIEIRTGLEPLKLLQKLKDIEVAIGREQTVQWGPRRIDIDILTIGLKKVNNSTLVIPHPRLGERNFVLIPLMELAPDIVVPGQTLTVEELYENCRDTCEVYIYED